MEPTKGAIEVKVNIRDTEIIVTDEVKVIALDATEASQLVVEFEAKKKAKALIEADCAVLQAKLYELMGYKKYADKWIGTAEEGTIGGVAVVKVGTQTRKTFNTEGFVVANPELLPLVEEFTIPNTFTVLKTVR